MACFSVLTSWETSCDGVISRCIVNKANETIMVSTTLKMSTNATSAAEDVNSLLGLSRNDYKTMLDVLYDYFTTHHEDTEQESDVYESQETLTQL